MDFVQRELQRVRQEIGRLQGQTEMVGAVDVPTPLGAKVIIPPGAKEAAIDSTSIRRAKSVTMDMPVHRPEELDILGTEETAAADDEDADHS